MAPSKIQKNSVIIIIMMSLTSIIIVIYIIVVSLKSIIMQGDEKNTHTQQHEVLLKIGLVEGKLQIRTAAAAAAGECQLKLVLYHATPQQRASYP